MSDVTKEQIEEFVEVVREFGDGSMSAITIKALAEQRDELVAPLRTLRRMAADPMESWDSGLVIDAKRVDEMCEEALEKLGVAP